MSSSFVTRIEQEKDEPYTVIFTTDDHDKYRHIEDECRKMIGHAKPTVDAVPVVRLENIAEADGGPLAVLDDIAERMNNIVEVVRCKDCIEFVKYRSAKGGLCKNTGCCISEDFYCADGERKGGADDAADDEERAGGAG